MYIRRPHDLPAREITDESLFWHRRAFLTALGGAAAAIALPGSAVSRVARFDIAWPIAPVGPGPREPVFSFSSSQAF